MRSWMNVSHVKKMTKTEAAWLAGIVDGEGSISMYMGGRNQRYKSWVLTVPNTHYGCIKRCLEITGAGAIRVKKGKSIPLKNKRAWIWAANSKREIRDIILQMFPYLVIKRKQAKKFLKAFRELA
jgi:hypothetical protein